ncbi:MAG: type VI secretion system lipoprotein TssJ [Rhodothermia bacterium]
MRRITIVFTTLLLLSGVWGCSGPKTVTLVVEGAGDMNTTSGGAGNAAEVRVYQLSNRVNFDMTGPRRFWDDDVAALGNELIGAPVQFSVFPNRPSDELEIVITKETRFIGIAANLREPDSNTWKKVYTIDQIDDDIARFLVVKRSIILESELDTDSGPPVSVPTILK